MYSNQPRSVDGKKSRVPRSHGANRDGSGELMLRF